MEARFILVLVVIFIISRILGHWIQIRKNVKEYERFTDTYLPVSNIKWIDDLFH